MSAFPSFHAFFQALHGSEPFPWQDRLAGLVTEGGWPRGIAAPTGSGKTACIDIALYAMARERRSENRRAPRRIVFVVDRRVVVDEAYERARFIADRLRAAESGPLGVVADRLRELGGGGPPLVTAEHRGGVYRDETWARNPAQPVVVVSTVDQVGSRLLFRGYGVSEFARSIHAGLLGNDALILLDEAHCSRAFETTLESVSRLRSARFSMRAPTTPFVVCRLSATLDEADASFALSDQDLDHPVLGPRLRATKPAELANAGKGKLVDRLEREALRFTEAGRVVGVVVNRVATARAVFERLRAREDLDALLLTGRVRPLERDALLRRWWDRIGALPKRTAGERPLVVVATQCIEVGANVDFDALVTEACPLDALRQRAGRLDRIGRTPTAPAVVVIEDGADSERAVDPVYGSALAATWRWLGERSGGRPVDLGVQAVEKLLPADPTERRELLEGVIHRSPRAPRLLPAHCDCLVQTSPSPHVEPEPAVLLHGVVETAADVHLVWRADLVEDQPERWAETVALLPPSSPEVLSVPVWVARRWLSGGRAAPEAADLEGAPIPEEPEPASAPRPLALRWAGPDSSRTGVLESPADLRPGDLLVVPASRGGCDDFGWNPTSTARVRDLAEDAAVLGRRAVLRFHPEVIAGIAGLDEEFLARWLPAARAVDLEENEVDVTGFLAELRGREGIPDAWRKLAEHLSRARDLRWRPHPSGMGLVLTSRKPLPAGSVVPEAPSFTDEDDTSSLGAEPIGLDAHLARVERRARELAILQGLPPDLVEDLALAARLHDLGKVDPRFQLWLHGADEVALARATGPLAKSPRAASDPATMRITRERAGYPEGGRHELLSCALASSSIDVLSAAQDPDLVLHLVASHHGRCRPLAPIVKDPAPETVEARVGKHRLVASTATGLERVDSGVAERFWRLVRRFGWWGLSLLEATLRLADHDVSRAEQEGRP
jgi:CRISPR-associated endonuclease/helicase Cas3